MSEAVEEYLGLRQAQVAPGTYTAEMYALRRLTKHLAGGRDPRVDAITVQHLQDYLYGKKGVMRPHRSENGRHYPGLSPIAHNNLRARLIGFFQYCQARGYRKDQPVNDFNGFRRLKGPERDRFRPNPGMMADMLNGTQDPMHRMMLALSINTLARASELADLRIGDIDLDSGLIHIRIHKTKQEDHFPISSDLDREIRDWLIVYAKALQRPFQDNDYLLPRRVAGRVGGMRKADGSRLVPVFEYEYRPDLPLTHAHRVIQKALLDAGRDEVRGEGVHTIRRAMARALFDHWAASGYSDALERVQAMLHHRNAAMTERYLGVSESRRKRDEAVKGMPLLSRLATGDNVVPLRKAQ